MFGVCSSPAVGLELTGPLSFGALASWMVAMSGQIGLGMKCLLSLTKKLATAGGGSKPKAIANHYFRHAVELPQNKI